jgi:adenylylsulfate kinase
MAQPAAQLLDPPWDAFARSGATLWLTGLPSAGKTTIAVAAAARLQAAGRAVEILDGDAVRPILCPELGYSRVDRDANVARIGWVAQRLAAHGVLVLAAVVSPYAPARDALRAEHRAAGVPFYEVHVATSVDVCASRDVKGLYARQRDGQLAGLTGIDGEYESPSHPELRLDTGGRTVDDVVAELLALLVPRDEETLA